MQDQHITIPPDLQSSLLHSRSSRSPTPALHYQPQPSIQGQCLLDVVTPVSRSTLRWVIFVCVGVLMLGLPFLVVYWYPKLRRKFVYVETGLEDCSHFYVVNKDGQPTFCVKEQGIHYFNEEEGKNVTYFRNRYLKYIVERGQIEAAYFNFYGSLKKLYNHETTGLNDTQVLNLRQSYGQGAMILERKGIGALFFTQIMRPLYIFIIMSCILWTYENYFSYGLLIFITAAGSITTSLVQTYRLNNKIHSMAYYEIDVDILRNGSIQRRSSRQLVPGDIVFIKQPMKIPFDGVLLDGSVLANQCSITGESIPVLRKAQHALNHPEVKNSYIYEGSVLIQVTHRKKFRQQLHYLQRYRQDYGLPFYVVRTNFITMKGQLIRIISFPIERQNQFQKQSVKFLLFLFTMTVISYIILAVKLAQNADSLDLFVKFLDLITVTVPPGLPVSMTFGIIYALEKLKDKKIFCTSPNKIALGGMTNLVCFDKTGTLTQDHMDFYALVPSQKLKNSQKPHFTEPVKQPQGNALEPILQAHPHIQYALNNMASNHTIVRLNTTGENIGDPMQVKMFQFGKFTLQQHQNHEHSDIMDKYHSPRGDTGAIYRRLQFDSELFRMSAIVKNQQCSEDEYHLYCKGSPQQMQKILQQYTVPADYHKTLKTYTSQGYRVLAIAHRSLPSSQLKLQRALLQSNIHFDGFLIFQNRLKKQSAPCIAELQHSDMICRMITGDNALTATSVGYECGILDRGRCAFVCEVVEERFVLERFRNGEAEEAEENKWEFQGLEGVTEFGIKNCAELVITGQALNKILDSYALDNTCPQLKDFFNMVHVFARAKPNDKARIIALYQTLGNVVSMCGDGANDCSALKQADIGLSLSQAQASISAPFTSQIPNISSMVELIKQCRAGLATNYSLFNIMAIYSLIQYNTVLLTQFYYGYPADFHWLYWDAGCNFIFFLTIGYTGTADRLSKQYPKCSLFTVGNITQLLLSFFLQMFGQGVMIYGLSLFADQIDYYSGITYDQFVQNGQQFVTDSYQSNILFFFTNFMYLFTMLAFSISRPWRKEFYTNLPYALMLFVVLGYSTALIGLPEIRFQFMEISRITYHPLLLFVIVLAWVFGLVIYFVQKFGLQPWFNARNKENRGNGRAIRQLAK